MKLEITLYREDLFIQKRDKDIKDIDIYDFPSITRELRDLASLIRFRDEVNGIIQYKTLKDREYERYLEDQADSQISMAKDNPNPDDY